VPGPVRGHAEELALARAVHLLGVLNSDALFDVKTSSHHPEKGASVEEELAERICRPVAPRNLAAGKEPPDGAVGLIDIVRMCRQRPKPLLEAGGIDDSRLDLLGETHPRPSRAATHGVDSSDTPLPQHRPG